MCCLALALLGCGAPDPAENDLPEDPAVGADGAAPAEAGFEVELLPLPLDRAYWYRATLADGTERPAVFFRMRQQGVGAHMASVGLEGFKLVRQPRRIVALPTGVLTQGAYTAWAAEQTWARGLGRRKGSTRIEVPAGPFRALRSDYGPNLEGFRLRHWFAAGVGLIRLEALDSSACRLLLELDEVARRGPPPPNEPYDESTPSALWASMERAVRSLDVDALDRQIGPRVPLRSGREALADLVANGGARSTPVDTVAQRVQRVIPAWIAALPRLAGSFVVANNEARAPGLINEDGADYAVVFVLTRTEAGWRWDRVEPGE
ncbi:hypothetical protein OAX78_00825 [Planctomycetota bacterium]|nr:hypothetical protein [Planctomycetota bacterium]